MTWPSTAPISTWPSVRSLHPKCHPSGRIEVSCEHGSVLLRVGCVECGSAIALVKVAEAPPG